MKSATFKIVTIALALMLLVVPVSAKTAGQSVDRGSGAVPGSLAVTPNLVDWYENWDAYPTDVSVHGLGGWKGWFNSPAATAYTRDEQAISAPNSIEIMGASDLVHEYAIDAGVWTYTAWQYIPTNFSGTTYFILLNQYDDAGFNLNWSTEVAFDSITDQLSNDGPDGGTLPIIYGQWVPIVVEIDLDADTQRFYYGGDLLFAGSWSNGMSGGGITSIRAVDLFANGATAVYYDDLSLVEVPTCEPPTGPDFTWNPPSPFVGDPVTFTGTAAGTEPLTFDWNFGDGGTATGNPVDHVYAAPGQYVVLLIVTNACGSAEVEHVVAVQAPPLCFTHLYKTKINGAAAARPGYVKVVEAGIVHNELHQLVAGATVSGYCKDPVGTVFPQTFVTDAMGRFKLRYKGLWLAPGLYECAVTDITFGDCLYDPAANDPMGIPLRTITVPQPPR